MSKPAHPALLDYPDRTRLGRTVPKSRIALSGKASRRVRDQLTARVARVIWANKLAPETLTLPATKAVPEIQIFHLLLKPAAISDELPIDILRCIDQAIDFPLIFELTTSREDGTAPDQVRVAASYKRPSEAEAGHWVISDYFATDWLPADTPRAPLPVALDLARLYEQILRKLIPLPAREGELIAELVDRQHQFATKQRECRRLETRLHREKQFNRKVELNRQFRELKDELDTLRKVTTESQRQHD